MRKFNHLNKSVFFTCLLVVAAICTFAIYTMIDYKTKNPDKPFHLKPYYQQR